MPGNSGKEEVPTSSATHQSQQRKCLGTVGVQVAHIKRHAPCAEFGGGERDREGLEERSPAMVGLPPTEQ